MEGRMSRSWAEQYRDEGYYYSPHAGSCQNPYCGHYPIFHRHILRHNLSGEVVEVGTHCYQRWRIAIGLSTAAWFDDYVVLLKEEAMKSVGHRIPPSQMRQIQEKTILRMVSRGKMMPGDIPPGVEIKLQRQARKAWLLKYCKEHGFALQQIRMPIQNFRTIDEADGWARERGGYCSSDMTIRKKKYWSIYINPHYREGQY